MTKSGEKSCVPIPIPNTFTGIPAPHEYQNLQTEILCVNMWKVNVMDTILIHEITHYVKRCNILHNAPYKFYIPVFWLDDGSYSPTSKASSRRHIIYHSIHSE